MNAFWGKVRIGVMAIFCAIALAIVAVARAQLAATPWPMFHHDLTHTGLSSPW